MSDHFIWCNTLDRCSILSYDASPTIDETDHAIWSIICDRCIIISYNALPMIDVLSYHHLRSTSDHVMIIYVMVLLRGVTVPSVAIQNDEYVIRSKTVVMSYDESPMFEECSCHMMYHLRWLNFSRLYLLFPHRSLQLNFSLINWTWKILHCNISKDIRTEIFLICMINDANYCDSVNDSFKWMTS